MTDNRDPVLGLILAGGMSQRMQPLATSPQSIDKCLLEWQGEPLITHVIRQASTQVDKVIVSTNSSDERYQALNVKIVNDDPDIKQCGPLSGILSTLRWINQQNLPYKWLATFPGDTPKLPSDIVKRLISAQGSEKAYKVISLQTGERKQPLFSLWSLGCLKPLEQYVTNGGRKVMQFIEEQPHCYVAVDDVEYALNNINTPEDWRDLTKR